MSSSGSPIEVVQHPFAFRLLQVVRSTWLTPHMVRVTLGGDALQGFKSDAADDGARLYFPEDVTDTSWAPDIDGMKLVFPENRQPPGREYTPVRHDPDAGELDFDFVVHGDGPASTWARNAAPGHYLGVSGPRRSRMVVGNVDWYLLAGDETGLPSLSRRLRDMPAGTRAVAVIEVADASEEQCIDTKANLEIQWRHRNGREPDTVDLLANAIGELEFPTGEIFAWASGEATSMRAVRRHLLQEREIPQDRMRITGYWKRAVSNYDHHLPLDE